MLDRCTSLLLNIKPTTPNLQIWAAGPPQVSIRNIALFEKIKAGWRARQGCCKTRKQLTAYYGFQQNRVKSNNIHPKCQRAVMLFIMLQNSFKATKHEKWAEAKSKGKLGLCSVSDTGITNVLRIQLSKGQDNTRESLEMNTKLMTKGKSEFYKTKWRTDFVRNTSWSHSRLW